MCTIHELDRPEKQSFGTETVVVIGNQRGRDVVKPLKQVDNGSGIPKLDLTKAGAVRQQSAGAVNLQRPGASPMTTLNPVPLDRSQQCGFGIHGISCELDSGELVGQRLLIIGKDELNTDMRAAGGSCSISLGLIRLFSQSGRRIDTLP